MLRNKASFGVVTNSLSLSLLILFAASTSFAASKPPFQVQTVLYQGSAYGVQATLSGVAQVGPTAQASLQQPCGTDIDNQTVTGTAAGVNDLPLITGGAANTSASSSPTMMASASSDVTSVSLLGGLITAQEIKSVSSTSLTSNGFQLIFPIPIASSLPRTPPAR